MRRGSKKQFLPLVGIGSLSLAITAPSAAQVVTERNYKDYASCVEVKADGKTYNSFGEGPCPPGSKARAIRRISSNPNVINMGRTQAAVNALGAAQQSMLAWGQAMAARMQAKSRDIAGNLFIEVVGDSGGFEKQLYTEQVASIPLAGSHAVVNAGELIVHSTKGFYSDCIVPRVPHEAKKLGGWNFKILPDEPACKLKSGDASYTPTYFNAGRNKQQFDFIYPLAIKADKEGLTALCFREMGMSFSCKKDLSPQDLVRVTGFVGDAREIRDAVLFVGEENDHAKIAYVAQPKLGAMPVSRSGRSNGWRYASLMPKVA